MQNQRKSGVKSAATPRKPILAFASTDTALMSATDAAERILATNLSDFGCTKCTTRVTANADSQPFCITCGSETKALTTTAIQASTDKSIELTGVQCSSCDTTTALPSEFLASVKHLHCSVCSVPLSLKSDANEMPENLNPEDDEMDDVQAAEADPKASPAEDHADEEDMTAADAEWPFTDETDPAEETESSTGDSGYSDLYSDLDSEDENEEISMKPEDTEADKKTSHSELIKDSEMSDEENNSTDSGMPEFLRDTQINLDNASEPEEYPEEEAEAVFSEPEDGEQLMDSVDMDDTSDGFTTANFAGRLVAIKGHLVVASLDAKSAGKNADILASSGMHAAVRLAVESKGLRKGLASMSFRPVRTPALSKVTVSRKVHAATEQLEKRADDKINVFSQSLALASAGLSRGNWKGYENHLRAAFEQELQRAGVRNPQRISASIFTQHAVPYSKTIVELASKLSKLTAAARAEMAEVLDMTEDNFKGSPDTSVADTSVDDEDCSDENLTFESRLNTTAALLRPPSGNGTHAVTASTYDAAQSVLSGASPLVFHNV